MQTTRSYLIGAGLVVAGFGLGWAMPSDNAGAQDAPRPAAPKIKIKPRDVEKPKDPWAREDGLPSFAYQTFTWQKEYASDRSDTSLSAEEIPGMPKSATEDRFLEHSDLYTIIHFYQGNNSSPSAANVKFKNVEKLHFMRIDALEAHVVEEQARISRRTGFWSSLSSAVDNQWGTNHLGIVFLPPPERDGRSSEYTWEIKRHENGRVKTVTPYIGETEKRAHGWRLTYNDEGKLTAMTPFVDGKRHGIERIFEGDSRSRLQEPSGTREWANGLRVVEKAPVKPRVPVPPKGK